jgi:hypothetical protein
MSPRTPVRNGVSISRTGERAQGWRGSLKITSPRAPSSGNNTNGKWMLLAIQVINATNAAIARLAGSGFNPLKDMLLRLDQFSLFFL